MTTRRTAIIILIGAVITWTTILFLFGFLPFLLSPLGLFMTAIWLLVIIWAGLISLRALAWIFILMGVFFLFLPFILPLPGIIGASLVPFFLFCVGINFAFGVLTAIISFFKEKTVLTTAEKKKHN